MDDTAVLATELQTALGLVRERCGFDFSGHRAGTLERRLQSRMIHLGIASVPDYLSRLSADPAEAARLVEAFTIKVSRFFRDPAAYAALEPLLRERAAAARPRPLSIWSAGCGRGEEPYGLALLLSDMGLGGSFRIVGTDIDAGALASAEAGRYGEAALGDVGRARRERYFTRTVGEREAIYEVTAELRQAVSFRSHDLASSERLPEAPFDLVCCRNTLIYLGREMQERVERLLLASLAPEGLLWLGTTEALVPALHPWCPAVNRDARIFRLGATARDLG